MRWTDFLQQDVLTRLANCNSRKQDIPALIDARMQWYKATGKDNFTREDALIFVLDLVASNSQDIELTVDEYNALICPTIDFGLTHQHFTTDLL